MITIDLFVYLFACLFVYLFVLLPLLSSPSLRSSSCQVARAELSLAQALGGTLLLVACLVGCCRAFVRACLLAGVQRYRSYTFMFTAKL